MKLIITIALYFATLLFGFILFKGGKPYNTGLFTVHKLVALAFVVLAVLQIRSDIMENGLTGMLLGAIILLGLSVIALFASGAMLSIGDQSG